jgi:hypothetical protein
LQKQQQMELFRLNKILIMLLLCFVVMQSKAQEILADVKLEKLSNQLYRVRYKLNGAKDLELYALTLKVYRRRAGQVEEIFSEPVSAVDVNLDRSQTYRYNWKPDTDAVKEGDELQAKVVVSYNNPLLAKKPSRPQNNVPPTANAGSFMEIQLPVSRPIVLNGSKSQDTDGKIAKVNWKQISGPTNLSINNPDSSVAAVSGDFKEGRYAFELTVADEWGDTGMDRIIITVKPGTSQPVASDVVKAEPPRRDTVRTNQQPVVNTTTLPKTQPKTETPKPALVVTQQTPPPPVKKPAVNTTVQPVSRATAKANMPALKGGPSNALVNILLPGLGHYRVSGDQYGNDRKPGGFIVTGLYLGSLGGAAYYKYKSTQDYKKYVELAKFREQQTDGNGDVIGLRGVNQAVAKQHLKDANTSRRYALILVGVGGGILAADLVYTFIKGSKNKRQWDRDAGLRAKIFLSSDGSNMTAGLRVNL